MKVAISVGGRFYALHLAHHLQKRNYLHALFTASYHQKDEAYISKNFVYNNRSLRLLDTLYDKLRLSYFIPSSPWYVFKDNLFDEWVKKRLEIIEPPDIFVGWSNYCLKTIPIAKKIGSKVIVESASSHILYKANLLQEEYTRFGVNFEPVSKKNSDKMLQEYEEAEHIIVPSKFVYESFVSQGISKDKLLRIPTGCGVNLSLFHGKIRKKVNKFRVIFVGLVGLRKGIQYLLDAWEQLDLPSSKAELLIVGVIEKNFVDFLRKRKKLNNVIFYGGIQQERLIDLYCNSSVFILPSIEEGLALVQAEAMAAGLPIIGTTNTGCSELIENNKEGFILPIRDSKAIAEKLLWCYNNQDECFEMGLLAQQRVQEFTWECFGDKVIEAYKSIL